MLCMGCGKEIDIYEADAFDGFCEACSTGINSLTFSNFVPTPEFIMYEALIQAGILPNDNRSAVWNDANAPIHKAWEYFKKEMEKYDIRSII